MALAQIDHTSSVLDSTVSILKVLTEDSQKKVLDFSEKLLERERGNHLFAPVSKVQVIKDLDDADEDIKAGRVKDAHRAMNDIRSRLGMRA